MYQLVAVNCIKNYQVIGQNEFHLFYLIDCYINLIYYYSIYFIYLYDLYYLFI